MRGAQLRIKQGKCSTLMGWMRHEFSESPAVALQAGTSRTGVIRRFGILACVELVSSHWSQSVNWVCDRKWLSGMAQLLSLLDYGFHEKLFAFDTCYAELVQERSHRTSSETAPAQGLLLTQRRSGCSRCRKAQCRYVHSHFQLPHSHKVLVCRVA